MEACLRAHFVSLTSRKLGFEPRVIPAKYTKFFVKAQKNDFNDVEVIAEATQRPSMKLVQEKPRISWTCRRCIVFAHGWSPVARRRSTRSAPS